MVLSVLLIEYFFLQIATAKRQNEYNKYKLIENVFLQRYLLLITNAFQQNKLVSFLLPVKTAFCCGGLHPFYSLFLNPFVSWPYAQPKNSVDAGRVSGQRLVELFVTYPPVRSDDKKPK